MRLLYVPLPTLPTQDADTIDGVNSWEDSIVIDVAMKMMAKEESDISALLIRKKALTDRLEAEVSNRDAGNPSRIVNVQGKRARSMQYRLNGSSLWLVGNSTPGFQADMGDWNEGDDFLGY